MPCPYIEGLQFGFVDVIDVGETGAGFVTHLCHNGLSVDEIGKFHHI